jgi:hypothetical protein
VVLGPKVGWLVTTALHAATPARSDFRSANTPLYIFHADFSFVVDFPPRRVLGPTATSTTG